MTRKRMTKGGEVLVKNYEIKINYKKSNKMHQFNIETGDKWNDERIIENIQWDRELTGKICNQTFEYEDYWQAFLDVKIFIDRMIWIQQFSYAEEGICNGTLKPDDYKDVAQDYIDFDHFVGQAVMEISEETKLLFHESDFLLGDKSRTCNLEWFFTEDCKTLRKTIAAIFRYSDKLPKEYVKVGFEKIMVIRTMTGHFVPITSTGKVLPYYTKEVLSKKIDTIDAEWELFGCLKNTVGVETIQQIVFVGHEPSGGLGVGLQMLTRSRKGVTAVNSSKISINRESYNLLKNHLDLDKLHSNPS